MPDKNNKPGASRNRSQNKERAGTTPARDARTATTRSCPNCGMGQGEWSSPEGHKQGGTTYCCEGCATDTGCTCDVE